MDHRIPSLSVADRIADGLRRRSGGPATHHASLHDDDDSVTLFEEDGLSRRCTVLPVKRSQSPSSTAELLAHSEDGATQQKEQPDPSESFIPIPLTPRPDPPSRAPTEASLQSTHTRASQIPRLPTPDFGNPSEKHTRTSATLSSFRSVFPRGLSFVSLHVPSTSFLSRTYTPASRRPQSVRSDSGESCGSAWSSCTTGSVDSGHTALIPSVGTTDKFTHKWPKPLSMRGLEMRGGNGRLGLGLGGITTAAAVLEEGRGLRTSSLQRWTTFKWCLLFSVCTVFAYGVAGLACAILTWFRTWAQADVMYVADNDILILITLAASIMVFTALVGISGVFLNSRPILATYTLLLWPAFLSLVVVGYISYKRATFALDHKLNLSWSQYYTPLGRLLIQNSLRCCGFYSPLHEGMPSKRCYPRTPLPGCKGKLYRFEHENLGMIWSVAFTLAGLHIINIVVALLCANHITRTFGKGITPKQYRLSNMDVRADADKILKGIRAVVRPELSRAPSSDVFRDDREEPSMLKEPRVF